MRKSTALTVLAAALVGAVSLLRAQGGGFRFVGPLSRVITPNGDGRNDVAVLCLDNPSDSGIDGRVYGLFGGDVAAMALQEPALAGCPGGLKPQSLTWNGTSNGMVVHSGIYVYQVRAEGLTYTGTLLVVR